MTAKIDEGKKSRVSEDEIRKAVRDRYTRLATSQASCCGSAEAMCNCGSLYSQAEILSLPADAMAVSAGCGNPTAIANLREGMVVVDLGSGGGIDAFLAAKKVGPTGKVYGIDATPEMVHRARRTARENSVENVEFRLGEIEHMPLPDNVADVIISNCVINLAPDKGKVFEEAYRVLKPGGRLAISDIVLMKELPEEVRDSLSAWSSCVSGAITEEEYVGAIERAGFENVKVEDRTVYSHEMIADYLKSAKVQVKDGGAEVDLSNVIASYKITAVKPKA